MIEALCREYTLLSYDDINKIMDISKSLQLMADFYESDVFIDVLDKNETFAIVVAHAIPKDKPSLYKEKAVGKKALKENEPGVIETLKNETANKDIKALTQENKFVKQRIHPILNEEKVVGVVIVENDISDELENNFKIDISSTNENSESKGFLKLLKAGTLITNNLHDGILVFDKRGKLVIKNTKADNIYDSLGYKSINYGDDFNKLSLDDTKFEDISNIIGEDSDLKQRIEVQVKNSYFELNRTFIDEENLRIIEIIKDISDIKNKEAKLVLKSVALREAHHRVKNSLQTTAALLRSQSRRCKSEEAKEYLQESVNRILAIATTHDLLSKSQESNIKVRDAIEMLTENIKKSWCGSNIDIYITGDNFYIDGEKLTGLLLIMNELIQNCFDHAFCNRDEGKIQILIQSDEEHKAIAVIDDGCGFDLDSVNNGNLGLFIVNSYLNNQLKGSMDIESNKEGTKVLLNFKIEEN
ncbi:MULTISPECIES: sensor histidine kinase [Clostridium]|uniref:histidine kinase n=2 Tax=Clostridium cadaveris TaxID=1529 RepID=A0A1I2JUB3_9CLOT|nr:sensor histidine kinase [Clostridium cadaveris]MDM8310471.1 sensor histidine kinase [Clostridium cadaveris]MDY4950730.1 sensor histidine kinase [Clostridium cadaveris]NME64632.1 histidine kinase [Clostridium cadaveris]NWK10729.1 sensor histidine kinase [Clostridium cadaveris]UFH66657.1 sensor histidine kinase [Clostridium cadaveris]